MDKRRVKVKLFQDDKIHEYNEDVAVRLEKSGRCRIIASVGARAAASRGRGSNTNK